MSLMHDKASCLNFKHARIESWMNVGEAEIDSSLIS